MYQSFGCKERSTPLNGDGFGVAWYVPKIRSSPGIFKAITPAWSNRNLINLCGVTESHCIMAHVRAATQGLGVSEANCHPFSWENLSFMHNGDIGCYKQLKKQILHLLSDEALNVMEGSTDSEQIFGIFLDQYRKRDREDPNSLVEATIETVTLIDQIVRPYNETQQTSLNLAISDGNQIVCTRFCTGDRPTSLYYNPRIALQDCSNPQCKHSNDGEERFGVVVASEPLNDDKENWKQVPKNHLLHVTTRSCELQSLDHDLGSSS